MKDSPALTPVLRETWEYSEEIDEQRNYKLIKHRKIEQLAFYIRPLREWFIPCIECQNKLKQKLINGRWILGNKEYKPDIELNTLKNEIDEESFTILRTRKATEKELERIGIDGYETIPKWNLENILKKEGVEK